VNQTWGDYITNLIDYEQTKSQCNLLRLHCK